MLFKYKRNDCVMPPVAVALRLASVVNAPKEIGHGHDNYTATDPGEHIFTVGRSRAQDHHTAVKHCETRCFIQLFSSLDALRTICRSLERYHIKFAAEASQDQLLEELLERVLLLLLGVR